MLTTFDNPYNPFEAYDQWKGFDEIKGYHTCSLLARIAHISDELSETDEEIAIENAINEIIKENTTGLYRKVIKET